MLATLGQRLAGQEANDLASQLPVELQATLTQHTGPAEIGDDVDDFCRRVAEREGRDCTPEQALAPSQAVLGTITSFVSAGEINDLKSQLPAGYAVLFDIAA